MLLRSCLLFSTFLLAASLSKASAETYSWTDSQGTVHFTEDQGKVPKKFRKAGKTVDENGSGPKESPVTEPPAKDQEEGLQAPPTSEKVDSVQAETTGDRSYDQWQKDLADREDAMASIRKQIDVIAARLNKNPGNWDEQKKLLLEHQSLVNRFKGMKSDYFQQVEIARKAGFKVNIQQ